MPPQCAGGVYGGVCISSNASQEKQTKTNQQTIYKFTINNHCQNTQKTIKKKTKNSTTNSHKKVEKSVDKKNTLVYNNNIPNKKGVDRMNPATAMTYY